MYEVQDDEGMKEIDLSDESFSDTMKSQPEGKCNRICGEKNLKMAGIMVLGSIYIFCWGKFSSSLKITVIIFIFWKESRIWDSSTLYCTICLMGTSQKLHITLDI